MTSPEKQSFDPLQLRSAFGAYMTGVTVVTSLDADGQPVGFTANSFSSVSLEPPLLSVCPSRTLSSFEIFNNCEYFQVSVLADNQQEISNTFASSKGDRFSEVSWHNDSNGCPVIDGAIVSFSCKRNQSIEAGDHIILLGEVTDFSHNEGSGLGYAAGGYFSLELERKASEVESSHEDNSGKLIVGALIEHDGSLLLIQDSENNYALPEVAIAPDDNGLETLQAYCDELCGQEVYIGNVHSVFERKAANTSFVFYRASVSEASCADPSQTEFVAFPEIDVDQFDSRAYTSMISRYLQEQQSGNHSLYVGTDESGKTHKLAGGK